MKKSAFNNSEKGYALLFSLFVITFFALLGTTFLNTAIVETSIARSHEAKSRSFYLAETGIAKGAWYLKTSTSPLDKPLTIHEAFATGNYQIVLKPLAYPSDKILIEGKAVGATTGALTKIKVLWEVDTQSSPWEVKRISWQEED